MAGPSGGAFPTSYLSGYFENLSEGVHVDVTNGVAGTAYPIGTPAHPVNNLTDAYTIAIARNLRTIFLHGGGFTLPDSMSSPAPYAFTFIGDGVEATSLSVSAPGGVAMRSHTFVNMTLSGYASTLYYIFNCRLANGTGGLWGFEGEDLFVDHLSTISVLLNVRRCYFSGTTYNVPAPATDESRLIDASGSLTLAGVNVLNTVNIYGNGLRLTINNTCVGGTINIYGDVHVTNNAAGTTVNDYTTRASLLRGLFSLDFWSDPQEEVQLTNVAGDKALPDIVVAGIPAGATIARAAVMFKFRAVENTNAAANKLNGAQDIQIRTAAGPGAWNDCINFLDDMYGLAATTREGGDVFVGDINVAAVVTGNGTYNLQWDEAIADLGNIQFNDVQVGLRLWFSV